MGIIQFHDNSEIGIPEFFIYDTPGTVYRPERQILACTLRIVRVGATIMFYDSPIGAPTDDFCIVKVKRSALAYKIPTFERTYEDDFVRVVYGRINGLNGQISLVRVA